MTETYFECGCCGHYHRSTFWGDCRQDDERFVLDDIPEDAEIIDLETDPTDTYTFR